MTVTIPTSAADLEAMLKDTKKLGELAKTPAALGEFISNYTKSQMEKNGEQISQEVKEQAQIVLAELLKDNNFKMRNGGTKIPGLIDYSQNNRKGAAYNEDAPGVPLDGEFKNLRDFLQSVNPRSEDQRPGARWDKIKNDYSTVDPATGGFLIPEVLRSTLLANSLESSLIRPRATVITMDGPTVPFPTVDETTHSGSVFGGITGTWVAEGEALPESEARFGRTVLKVNKLVTYCEAPRELPQDAPRAFGDFMDAKMPAAIAFFEDQAFLTGTGVGRPLGMLNTGNGALVTVAKRGGQGADTIVWENIVDMFSRMLPSSLKDAIWIAAIDTFPELATMALSVGTGGSAIWLNNGASGPPMTILGRPVYFSEKLPKLGDASDLSFVDPKQYLVGDKMEMRVESSTEYKFGNDVVAYRVIERADGRPWMKSALTPANGSTSTLSPYVTLGERA